MALWGRRRDEEDEPEVDESVDDLPLADDDGDPEADEPEGDDEPLEPEVQARVDKLTAQRVEAQVNQIREAARKRGLDWTGSDLGVVDHGRAAQAFGFGQPSQQPQEYRQQPAAEEEPDPEPELDEFNYDAAQVKAHNAWLVRQQLKPLQQENQRLRGLALETRLETAMDRAEAAVKRYAAHLEGVLEHPKFAETYRGYLLQQAPEAWTDPKNLAKLVALASVDLDPDEMPERREERPREQPRSSVGAERRRQLDRMSPTRDAGRPVEDDLTPGERQDIRRGRFESAAEVRALRSGQYDDYEKFLTSKQKGNGR